MEPLLVKLRELLSGFMMPNFNEIDNDYCDDVEIVVENENDLILANEIFTKFETVEPILFFYSYLYIFLIRYLH